MNIDGSFRFLPIPTEIHFGCGVVAALPDRLRSMGCRRAFLVTDSGVRDAGLVDQLTRPLAAAGMDCIVYDFVTADSGTGLIAEAADIDRAELSKFAAQIIHMDAGAAIDRGGIFIGQQ